MFITSSDAEVTMFSALFGQGGRRQWTCMELLFNLPWYCVEVSLTDEDGNRIAKTLLLAEPEQLAGLDAAGEGVIEWAGAVLPARVQARDGGR